MTSKHYSTRVSDRGFAKRFIESLPKANNELKKLQSEGWASMPQSYVLSDARQIESQLKQRGMETKFINVAKWGDEDIVFMVYKSAQTPTTQVQGENWDEFRKSL